MDAVPRQVSVEVEATPGLGPMQGRHGLVAQTFAAEAAEALGLPGAP
jgi:hypothetical protein